MKLDFARNTRRNIAANAAVQVPWETRVVFTSFFGRAEARAYWRGRLFFLAVTPVFCLAGHLAAGAVPAGGFPGLAAKGAAAAAACLALALFRRDVAELVRGRGRAAKDAAGKGA